MTAPNPTLANTELWHAYIGATYGPLIRPFWGEDGVAAVAEGVSLFMTSLMGGTIARMYLDNAPEVTAFADATRAEPPSAAFEGEPAAASLPQLAPVREPALLAAPWHADTVPPWLTMEAEATPPADVGAYEGSAV